MYQKTFPFLLLYLLLNFLYIKYTTIIVHCQGKSLEKAEKTTKYFTPLSGGEVPRPHTPHRRGPRVGSLAATRPVSLLPMRVGFP
jgi:hypothetical protein